MRVFIDTNILIDFVVNREGFSEDADKLFALGITGDIKLMTSALSYVTTMYIAHKYEYQDVKETLLAVSNFVDVLDLQGNTVIEMLSSDWKDYEDATQNATALRAEGDCIVTILNIPHSSDDQCRAILRWGLSRRSHLADLAKTTCNIV